MTPDAADVRRAVHDALVRLLVKALLADLAAHPLDDDAPDARPIASLPGPEPTRPVGRRARRLAAALVPPAPRSPGGRRGPFRKEPHREARR